ncbi:MAG: hypothetical protein J3K34DRAFT_459917 [Monoraphidium minutum]|nr:MAG: hypothetical protein J3K34DRAFT_459917 [Monoraphidium minutum]
MGHSPKSRVRELLGGPSARGARKGRSPRLSMVMLWMAAAVAVTGVYQLESKYDLAGMRAWRAARRGAPAAAAPAAGDTAAAAAAATAAAPAAYANIELSSTLLAPGGENYEDAFASGGAAPAAAPAAPAPPVLPRALLLATHSRLLWYDPATDESTVLHEGEGVHYGMFPGEGSPPSSVWTAIRPHNWKPTTSKEHLVEFDMRTGAELRRVEIPSRFTHDVVRAGRKVYVCDTGGGAILEYNFPAMTLARRVPLFTLQDHANTLAPYHPNETLVMLHNLGSSDMVRVDLTREPPQVIGRLQGVGKKAHGIVKWHGAYITLDSDNGALTALRLSAGGAKVQRLWQAPEPHRFLKGLAVVDDVAYFGISEWAPRSARDDPGSNCQLAAFDLLRNKLLWRREVPTAGLLNIVGAPHLTEDSTYSASYTPKRVRSYKTPRSGEVVAEALRAQEALGYTPKVGGYWSSGMPFLDASAKATPKPWTAGLQVPLMHLDVSEAKALLLATPPEVWTREYQAVHSAVMGGRESNTATFKPGVQGIALLFSAGSGEGLVYEFPLYKRFAPVLEPLIEEMIGAPDMANIIRMQLALMRANNSDIRIHVDTGGYATYAHRLHIPLMTNPGVAFDLCPFKDDAKTQQECHKVPTWEGFAFELNNKVPHRVSNLGPSDRVHLVVDVAEVPRQRAPLAAGTVCDYDVNRGLFCGADAIAAAAAAGASAGGVAPVAAAAALRRRASRRATRACPARGRTPARVRRCRSPRSATSSAPCRTTCGGSCCSSSSGCGRPARGRRRVGSDRVGSRFRAARRAPVAGACLYTPKLWPRRRALAHNHTVPFRSVGCEWHPAASAARLSPSLFSAPAGGAPCPAAASTSIFSPPPPLICAPACFFAAPVPPSHKLSLSDGRARCAPRPPLCCSTFLAVGGRRSPSAQTLLVTLRK